MDEEFKDMLFEFKDVAGHIVQAKFLDYYIATNGNTLIKVVEPNFNYVYLLKPEDKDIKWKLI